MRGGVTSVCMARTEDGARKVERLFVGVNGDPGFSPSLHRSSSEPLDVRGEL